MAPQEKAEDASAIHVEPATFAIEHRNRLDKPEDVQMVVDAQAATAKEHSMTLWQGLKLYPKAIGWSLLFSTVIIMEGYDVVLMGSFYAYPTFREKYGNLQPDGTYELPGAWQAGISNAMNVGQIIGLFINGFISERFGYRKTMLGALLATTLSIFILFFAPSKPVLLVGELCIGVPLGIFQTLAVTYAAEVCPVVLRAYLTTYVNLCWVIGQILGSAVLRGMLDRTDEWGYRIPFALQWIWPVPIAVGVFLAPESPWWLVRTDQVVEAKMALRRLASTDSSVEFNVDETIAMISHTNELEKQISAGMSYADCFTGIDLRRTEITCLTWAVQNLCGAGLMGYSTYFYKAAGLAEEQSFNMSLAQYGLGFFGTLFSWVLMTHIGRRRLYVVGLFSLCVLLLVVGFISLAPGAAHGDNVAASWATGSVLLVYTFIYDATVGPVCYSLVSEMPSTRLRNKTIVLARNLYNVFSIVNGVIIPFMLNPSEWDWAGKAGFFWAGLCFCSACWAFFRLPEPKGRTFGELDVLFEAKVPARKFRHIKINPFSMQDEKMVEKEE